MDFEEKAYDIAMWKVKKYLQCFFAAEGKCEDYQLGDDVTDLLGIRKWEIEERVTDSGSVIG